ncbi:MAG: O-antigen ligase family protein [Caulobacterales bacterium]
MTLSNGAIVSPEKSVRFGAYAIATFFVLAAPISVVGALGLAAFQGLAGLLGAPWRSFKTISAPAWIFTGMLLTFAIWAAGSALWSQTPSNPQGLKLIAGVALGLLFVAGAGKDAAARRLVRASTAGFAIVLVALLAAEAIGSMPVNRLVSPHEADLGIIMRNPSRGASVLMVVIWGVVAALAGGRTHERLAWMFILLGAGFISLQFSMAANTIAFGAGALAYIAAFIAPRFSIVTAATGIAAWLVAAPFAIPFLLSLPQLQNGLPASWQIRANIWNYVITQIAERPIIGWGLDESRHHSQPAEAAGITFPQVPLHPHSASLQIWYETGAIGALLAAAALVTGGVLLARAKLDRQISAGACAAMVSCSVISNVSYGAWQEWWIAALFTAAATVTAARR